MKKTVILILLSIFSILTTVLIIFMGIYIATGKNGSEDVVAELEDKINNLQTTIDELEEKNKTLTDENDRLNGYYNSIKKYIVGKWYPNDIKIEGTNETKSLSSYYGMSVVENNHFEFFDDNSYIKVLGNLNEAGKYEIINDNIYMTSNSNEITMIHYSVNESGKELLKEKDRDMNIYFLKKDATVPIQNENEEDAQLETEGTMSGIKYTIYDNKDNSKYSKRGYYIETNDESNASYYYAIAMGEKSTGGYSISITDLKIDENKNVEITVKETKPEPFDEVTTALTYPVCCLKLSDSANKIVIKNTDGEIFEDVTESLSTN